MFLLFLAGFFVFLSLAIAAFSSDKDRLQIAQYYMLATIAFAIGAAVVELSNIAAKLSVLK